MLVLCSLSKGLTTLPSGVRAERALYPSKGYLSRFCAPKISLLSFFLLDVLHSVCISLLKGQVRPALAGSYWYHVRQYHLCHGLCLKA